MSWWLLLWSFFPLFLPLFFTVALVFLFYSFYLLGKAADDPAPLRSIIGITVAALLVQASLGTCLHYQAHKEMLFVEQPAVQEP